MTLGWFLDLLTRGGLRGERERLMAEGRHARELLQDAYDLQEHLKTEVQRLELRCHSLEMAVWQLDFPPHRKTLRG